LRLLKIAKLLLVRFKESENLVFKLNLSIWNKERLLWNQVNWFIIISIDLWGFIIINKRYVRISSFDLKSIIGYSDLNP
jgi:hypothetical protein